MERDPSTTLAADWEISAELHAIDQGRVAHNIDGPSMFFPRDIDPQRLYDELRSVARAYLSRESATATFQPTSLIHEALIRLNRSGKVPAWTNPREFFALAAVCMQRVLVEHARAKKAAKRCPDAVRGGVPASGPAAAGENGRMVDVIAVAEALERLECLDLRAATLVRLRFFAGLTVSETAQVLGVSVATAENDWRVARAWLAGHL